MTRMKICGITNLEDALCCALAGVDYLGFVFAASPRRIQPDKARQICEELPSGILKTGVFVDEEPAQLMEIVNLCRLDMVQLQGTEDQNYLRRISVPFLKVFKVGDREVLEEIREYNLEVFMLDTLDGERAGGTGKSFDWKIASQASGLGKTFLSGGLNPENVARAITQVKPFAVDVSSGVEESIGKKDPDKVRKFITEVRRCDSPIN